MPTSPLTSAQLANYEASLRADAETGEGMAHVPALEVAEVFAELREMRALMETPWPRNNETPLIPRYQPFVTAPGLDDGIFGVASGFMKDDLLPDEAIALGAALIRAGRKASE